MKNFTSIVIADRVILVDGSFDSSIISARLCGDVLDFGDFSDSEILMLASFISSTERTTAVFWNKLAPSDIRALGDVKHFLVQVRNLKVRGPKAFFLANLNRGRSSVLLNRFRFLEIPDEGLFKKSLLS